MTNQTFLYYCPELNILGDIKPGNSMMYADEHGIFIKLVNKKGAYRFYFIGVL